MSHHIYTLPDETQTATISASGPDGLPYEVPEAVVIKLVVPLDDVAHLVAEYSSTDPATPSVDTAREISRAVLAALAVYSV